MWQNIHPITFHLFLYPMHLGDISSEPSGLSGRPLEGPEPSVGNKGSKFHIKTVSISFTLSSYNSEMPNVNLCFIWCATLKTWQSRETYLPHRKSVFAFHSPDYSSILEICSGMNGTDWVFIHSKNDTLHWRIPEPPASITHFLSVWMKSLSFERTRPSCLCLLACCSSCLTTNNSPWKADLIKLAMIFPPPYFPPCFPWQQTLYCWRSAQRVYVMDDSLHRCSSLHVDLRDGSGTTRRLSSSASSLKPNTAPDGFQIRHMTNRVIRRVRHGAFGPASVPEALGFCPSFSYFRGK